MKTFPFFQTFSKQKGGGSVVFLEKSSADFARKKYKKKDLAIDGIRLGRNQFQATLDLTEKSLGNYSARELRETNWKASNFRNLCFRTH